MRVRWILQNIGDGGFHDSLLVGGLLALKTETVLVMIRFPIKKDTFVSNRQFIGSGHP